ncbi:L-2-hydroxyglutarate oxidase [Brevibacterium daeguense]|uniref:L-2-hydroxyglutarate oxidase n=1 Tax=Brevibacterium daeguense TaxID=909936 RepID=A0ABP8EJZ4_9MICO|nr:L-2-hydroxyglutarate oxidase [Brevibacterium daeguense]
MRISRIAVVGGGIIGTAVARELALRCEDATVTIFEKEPYLAAHQTGHNSGVVHAGLYYEPGSLKARLCRTGVAKLVEYSAVNGIHYEECGKLVVAHTTAEVDRLEAIFERAKANGVPHVKLLDRNEMREVEPHVRGVLALHSPHTAIIDFAKLAESFAADVTAAGGRIEYNSEVARLDTMGNEVRVALALPGIDSRTTEDGGSFDLVVTCAGLQADRLAAASGLDSNPRIVPFHGDYFVIDKPDAEVVRGLIYPVPDPAFPFLGVHLTRRIDGALMLGPNAFVALGREKYERGGFDLGDIGSTLGFKGFWKFASQNVRAAAREARTALSPKAFIEEAQKYVPDIDPATVKPGPRGVRAQAMNPDGSLVDDFVITTRGRLTQVRNAPSPGATSSMAIAEYVADKALGALR